MAEFNPFKGRTTTVAARMRTVRRFSKAGGHWAEIREREVTKLKAFEFLVFVDGSLLESQLFHGARAHDYPKELTARINQFLESGWIEEASNPDVAH